MNDNQEKGGSTGRENDGLFPIPVSTRQFQAVFYAAIASYITYLLITGRNFSFDDLLLPLIVGIPTIIIAIIHLTFIIFPTLEERVGLSSDDGTDSSEFPTLGPTESDKGRSQENRHRYGLLVISMVTLLPIFIYYFGFAYAISPFVLTSIWVFRRDLKIAFLVTAGFSLIAYVMFIVILQMQPYEGALGLPNLLRIIQFG